MVRSLRWRLQVWHAAILAFVVIGFGSALYFQLRRTTFKEIDSELLSGARVLEASLRVPPRPPGFRPGPPPDNRNRPRGPLLGLPPSLMYGRGPEESWPYFAVFNPQGDLIAGDYDESSGIPPMPPREFIFRNLGSHREVVLRGTGGHMILVGRDINPIIDNVNQLLWPIVVSGIAVLAVGLLGSWWLAGRAIEPLEQICTTASSVTAQSLTSRIDVSKMDKELRQLGSILNSMLQRLEDSFEQQTQFVADASHELRTPISVLAMHCELALSRERQPEEYRATLTTCARASERMRSLVEDLLILARADAGQLVSKQEPIDLRLIVEESIQLLSPMAAKRNITIDCQTSFAPCLGDSNQLLRLTSNLLSNAILYNRSAGRVTITTRRDGGDSVLCVQDTGVGVAPEDLERIFERFYRVDEARSRECGGSGLGLAICQSIATGHGGKLVVQSERDVGTTAELRLPNWDELVQP